ncbi:MAG: alcohol dehydrogenase catalytic domain-containing protein, partial [Chloroflexota bacterium]
MKALLCKQFGEPDTLVIEEVASTPPLGGEVRIRVRACGVNFADGLMVKGLYQVKPPFPFSPGTEVAGDVLAVGEGVTHVQPGQRVMSLFNWGGMAEEVNAPAMLTLPIPDTMPYINAAALSVAYGTAHIALAHRGQLQAGETLLVLGAAGGTG